MAEKTHEETAKDIYMHLPIDLTQALPGPHIAKIAAKLREAEELGAAKERAKISGIIEAKIISWDAEAARLGKATFRDPDEHLQYDLARSAEELLTAINARPLAPKAPAARETSKGKETP